MYRPSLEKRRIVSETKGSYHFLKLASPKELVLIGVNGNAKAGPRDYSRDLCGEYTQELI